MSRDIQVVLQGNEVIWRIGYERISGRDSSKARSCVEFAEARLSVPQARGCGKEQHLLWTGPGQQQPKAPGVAQHHGAGLEESQPDRANIGTGQLAQRQIPGDANDVVHTMALAPPEHPSAAKAAGAAKHDLDLRPIPGTALHAVF